jgi:hypothetical protein
MNETNKRYLDDCLKENDLMVMGIYDKKQDYGMFHKWGKKKDVENVIRVMKRTARHTALDDNVYVTYKWPEFTIEQFHDFIDRADAFTEFHKEKVCQ